MEEPSTSLELKDIPDVSPLIPSPGWPWWVWVLVGVGVLILLLMIRLSRKKQDTLPNIRLRAFREALASLEKMPAIASPVALATGLSLTLRHYLAAAFQEPSLFETHEEFMARHNALATLPQSVRENIGSYFQLLARYKYAPVEGEVDLKPLIPQANELLHILHANPPVIPPALP